MRRLFISWVGPRGIVAAGIASLFGSKLLQKGEVGAEYITPLVFMIVLGTVLFNATTARIFAKIIGVFLTKSEGILIIGAGRASRLIARYLQNNDRNVVLLDNNASHINTALEMGLQAITANIYADDLKDDIELSDVGYLMALTGSGDINKYALRRFEKQFGENGSLRLVTKEEIDNPDLLQDEMVLSNTDDFINMVEVARKYPTIQEVAFDDDQSLENLLAQLRDDINMIPLFIKNKEGSIEIIKAFQEKSETVSMEGCLLAYLGKPLTLDKTA